ncbi:hypothetical protein BLNAU_16229 [Blattamonas nauphoetae]|uniref:Uncharacterized protein n=1 Tax=Blattamonas nauphoetae TaxID=2049346 RepID=A0ABQ9XAD2_9EUKA|nr:hypothetical protein BLNAU_16229 [Blattamonas nauphoetae]
MEMMYHLLWNCSPTVRLSFIKAELLHHLIAYLNPQSLSFKEAEEIHTLLMSIVTVSIWLATQDGLSRLKIEDVIDQQAVHETVLQQVLYPSEKYIGHLCMNRYSIVSPDLSSGFVFVLTHLIEISAAYQPTMDFVLKMSVFLTIPSCLTFFEIDDSIFDSLDSMRDTQQEWNKKREKTRHMQKKVHQILRMEGMEDVIEEKLRNDRSEYFGEIIVGNSIKLNNLLGMNLSQQE